MRIFLTDLKISNKNKYSNKLIIYHRNILSLNKKRDELSIIIQFSLIRPHLICLSEHHLREQEIKKNISLNNYRLAWSFCREGFSEVGICIMTRTVYLNKFCSAKTFEACATKVNTKTIKIIVCCIYLDLHPEIWTSFLNYWRRLKKSISSLLQISDLWWFHCKLSYGKLNQAKTVILVKTYNVAQSIELS